MSHTKDRNFVNVKNFIASKRRKEEKITSLYYVHKGNRDNTIRGKLSI